MRLDQIYHAANLAELPHVGRLHPLKGNRQGQFAINLAGGCRLVLAPNPAPEKGSNIDRAEVTKVTIVFIGDYHD